MSVMASQTPAIWPFLIAWHGYITAKETYVHSPIPEEINCDILPLFLWNHLYAVLSKVWQQMTYPDIMEIIRSLFLNYFATLRIPLTLPVICRIISLAI